MLPENVAAVLFDFDGTLAPNLDLPSMRQEVIDLTHQHDVPAAVYKGQYIVEIIEVATQFLRENAPARAAPYHEAAHQLIRDIEIQASLSTAPFAGVDRLLSTLRSRGIQTGVVTRNCREAVLQVYPELLAQVDVLLARDDTRYLKPDPRHLLEALAAIQATPAGAAMVGDGALDMTVGKAAGLYCIGVLSGSADRPALVAAGADAVVGHCIELQS